MNRFRGCTLVSSRALANQEREVQVQRLGRIAKALLLSLATLMTFAVVLLLIADKLYRPDAFVIDQLKIKGQFQYLVPEEVQQAVFKEKIGNFFSIELNDIKQRIEAMPWVQHADVRREWPHTLSVQVREHRPVMRWHSISKASVGNEKLTEEVVEQWVSTSGEIISLESPLNKVSPIDLRGTDHEARELLLNAMKWQKRLALSGIRVLEVSLSASQAWNLTLAINEKQFELLLGREHGDERLDRFQTLFDTQLKQAPKQLVRVDARYPDGVAVKAIDIKVEEPEEAPGDVSGGQVPNSIDQTAVAIDVLAG